MSQFTNEIMFGILVFVSVYLMIYIDDHFFASKCVKCSNCKKCSKKTYYKVPILCGLFGYFGIKYGSKYFIDLIETVVKPKQSNLVKQRIITNMADF